MSVINQMLRDLDRRGASTGDGVYHAKDTGGKRLMIIAFIVFLAAAVFTVAAVIYAVRKHRTEPAPDALKTEQVQKAESAVAAKDNEESPDVTAAEREAVVNAEPAPLRKPNQPSAGAEGKGNSAAASESAVSAERKRREELADVLAGPDQELLRDIREREAQGGAKSDITGAGSGAGAADAPEKPRGTLSIEVEKLPAGKKAELSAKSGDRKVITGELDGAEEDFLDALEAKPRDSAVRMKLASLYFGRGDLGAADDLLSKGIALDSSDWRLRGMLAKVRSAGGNRSGALTALTGFSPEAAKETLPYYELESELADEAGDCDSAAAAYRKLWKIAPQESRYGAGLAIAYDRCSQKQAAINTYRKVLKDRKLDPNVRDFAERRLRVLGGKK